MCGGPEHPEPCSVCGTGTTGVPDKDNNNVRVNKLKDVGGVYSSLLESAANNDLISLEQILKEDVLKINEASFWYGRKHGFNQMALEQRTPVMIAALFGSLDVLNYILTIYSTYGFDINHKCGSDNSTALHCAAAGGACYAIETVKLLIQSGADINSLDALGRRPADLIMFSPKLPHGRSVLKEMLNANADIELNSFTLPNVANNVSKATFCFSEFVHEDAIKSHGGDSSRSGSASPLSSPPRSSSPELSYTPCPSTSPNFIELSKTFCVNSEKKEYPIDPSLPDIKNSIYSTDEFRMFCFKVRPCSRAYSHDWTECPFVHPGENARRRDPRRFHYSCVPCPDFRKGDCGRGDACEYAHGVFESWLHPAQYRTRLCKDGTSCARRVCFFAHKPEELRPLYVSTGSAVSSPRTSAPIDMATVMAPLVPGSPSSVLMMPSFSPSNSPQTNLFTPPMSPSSPSASKACHSSLGVWSQSNLPTLHLPSGGCQTSRLRAALSARDLPLDDQTGGLENDGQIANEALSNHVRMNAAVSALSGEGSRSLRSGKYRGHFLNSASSKNLDDLFAYEISLPGVADVEPSVVQHTSNQVQSNKTMQGHLQLQNQKQLSIGTQTLPRVTTQMHQVAADPQSPRHSFLQTSMLSSTYGLSSLGRMPSINGDLEGEKFRGSPLSPVMSSNINSRSASFSNRERSNYGHTDLGAHLVSSGSSDWASPNGKLDWGVHGEELSKFRKSASFGYRNSNELDSSWNQFLVKDSLTNGGHDNNQSYSMETSNNGTTKDTQHAVLASWIDQMHLDQKVS
ncbi:zinc finger CCCH domain-containing protein 30 isoform X1 [Cryptomeria japonica]|uniref:zinc finger CCCH domain-containing protein 30 isoform X1 n=1 Tax=Cryptomeria japonica TaxID=3369 RepID=UPI0025ABDEC6|nr:zinc finger CCCH domain-containing protein 30 isoform X1 [Cryptomeria japonica]